MKNAAFGQKFYRYVGFRCAFLTAWTAILILLFAADSVSAQSPAFEEITSPIQPAQYLPSVASPKNSYHGIIQASGSVAKDDEVVLAQFPSETENQWEQQHITLPSIRLVQGLVPTRVAAVGRPPVNSSPYQGAGRVLQNDAFTETNSPTLAEQSPRSLTTVTPPQPSGKKTLSQSSHSPNQSEIQWDDNASPQNFSGNNGYETVTNQFNDTANYDSQNVGGEYADSYGGMYGDANAYFDNSYAYGGQLPGVYGNEMYGYDYSAYLGNCPPMFMQSGFSSVFYHIMCSGAWENLTVGVGGSGFKSPMDYINGGGFGFHETVNWASPSSSFFPVSFQAGVRAVQAYPSGYRAETGLWRRDNREQYFGTVGVFRRNLFDRPIHFGVAYDTVKDKYYSNYRLEQLRSELAFGSMSGIEYGYRGAKKLRDDSIRLRNGAVFDIRTASYHTLFVKKYFGNGGEGSLAGGVTESGDAILRAEYNIPLSNTWGLKNSLMYVFPQDGRSFASQRKESWDVSLQLIYQPHGGVLAGFCNPFRAFFDVGDNGTVLQERK